MEISAEQLKKLNDGEYTVYDIRSETDRAYGFIPGSVHTTADELENNPPADRDKKIIIYCAHGVFSIDIADRLCEQGYEAYSSRADISRGCAMRCRTGRTANCVRRSNRA